MKKDILFLGQFFYPENNSSATLPFDTACGLVKAGYSVDALVGYPKEYCDKENIPLKECTEGVNIQRIRYLQLSRGKKLSRLINYLSFTLSAILHLFKLSRYRSVIVYSNPPVLPLVAVLGNLLFGTKIVFVAYDVYPEIAYASNNVIPGSLLDKGMRCINHLMYKRVSCVVALTDEMKSFLLENRPELTEDRVVTIANWAHEQLCAADQEAYETLGYESNQFVVSYFGNLGICQDVQTLLDAAKLLKDEPGIRFLIVGHGAKMADTADQIREYGLHNVQLLDFLTGKKFEQAISVSSCCVVSLEKGIKGMCAPSKFYSYLQGGKPVLAVVEEDSYLREEILREQVGRAVTLGDADGLAQVIRLLAGDPEGCAQMGVRARQQYDERYAMQIGLDKYTRIFTSLFEKK